MESAVVVLSRYEENIRWLSRHYDSVSTEVS